MRFRPGATCRPVLWELLRDKTITLGNGYSVRETVKRIAQAAEVSRNEPEVKALVKSLRESQQPERDLFEAVFKRVLYQPDPDGFQDVKLAGRTLIDGRGNCVDYVVIQSAALRELDIPHRYRVIDVDGDGYHHIYIVTNAGIVLDPVIGQAQDGSESHEQRGTSDYNSEVPHLKRFDYMPTLRILGNPNPVGYQMRDRLGRPNLNECSCYALGAHLGTCQRSNLRSRCDSIFSGHETAKKACRDYISSLNCTAAKDLGKKDGAQIDAILLARFNHLTIIPEFTPPGPDPDPGGGGGGGGGGSRTYYYTSPPVAPAPQQAGFSTTAMIGLGVAALGLGFLFMQRGKKKGKR